MAGRGPRSAAAATPRDAALLLLVAACEFPPLHAVTLGEALLACDILVDKDDWPEDLPLATTAIDQTAMLIAWPCPIYRMRVNMGSDLSMGYECADEGSLRFQTAIDDPAVEKLISVFGRRSTRLMRRHEIEGRVLRDIGDWLSEAEAEDSAA